MADDFIPVSEPILDGNEAAYLAECIETKSISSQGAFVRRLEEGLAALAGHRYGIAVTNGTAALELCVKALGVGPGDEVILPAFTIISCAAAVVRAGATPVLVDCEPDTWNMAVDRVAEKITPRTKAIMAVHIYGLPVDMNPLAAVAGEHGIPIIEDAAEAIGLTYGGRQCGGIGLISAYSFYANKHVTTGEGGMVTTSDPEIAEKCRSYRNLCFGSKRFVHEELGWNMRLSNLQAAIGVAQLERLEATLGRKRAIGRRYTEKLAGVSGLRLPLERTDKADNAYWVYGVVLDKEIGFDAAEAIRGLTERRIDSRPFFWPMHEQPVFRRMGLFDGESYPVSENLARCGLYLPSGVALTDDQLDRVVEAVHEVLA